MLQGKKYQIFYTDDDVDDQDFFKEIVTEIDDHHAVYTQNHGDELIQLLKSPPPNPDIIFLDLNMPQKNGFDVLKEIRSDESLMDLPVVILSTSNSEESINACKKLGASLYVCKPESYNTLKKTMDSLLSIDWKNFNLTERKDFVFTAN